MSKRVTGKALRGTVAMVGIVAAAATLSGCTGLGGSLFSDSTVTGSIGQNGAGTLNQPMPGALGASTKVAAGPYIPPADIGSNTASGGFATASLPAAPGAMTSVSTEDLPVLTSSPANGNAQAMPAQPNLAPLAVETKTAALANQTATPNLAVVPQNAYVHVIESGESLYTIARRYDVTAQAIVQANGLSSPDKIFVGQKVIIPGRPDLLTGKGQIAPVSGDQPAQAPVANALMPPANAVAAVGPTAVDPALTGTPVPAAQAAVQQPVQQAAVAPQGEPQMSDAEKFRWPISGKVITDFANSKGTGINIEAPEGSSVRAAENGTVIYVGSGVEGYGNLILIRHPNGYVSAYAHLKAMNVVKGDVVSRGDNIGAAGMTGSVSRPQLHFELRKGATPVDPVPLLAG